MKKIKSIIATATAVATVITTAFSANACYDEGENLPIIEGVEIAEFFDSKTPETFSNFYLATDGKMYGLNYIVSCGQLWKLSDGGYYSESGKVWVLFNDNDTYEFEDDEIVEIFQAPTNDSEELEIYDVIYNNMFSIR